MATKKTSRRDTAIAQPGTNGTGQPGAVSQRRPKGPKLPTTVNINGELHWAANATTTLCGKHWSPAQMVKPSKNVCSDCRAEAIKRGI